MEHQDDPSALAAEPFEFTGTGGDYFRIWIVNIALTIVTVGIYSAWAKVRRLQYFARNTRVAGASFDYHGKPMAILKGRLIAGAIVVVYNLAQGVDPRLALIVAIPVVAVLPWILRQSLRFRLHNSSWRGLRFAFRGSLGGAYGVFLLWPFLSAITLYGLAPMWHQRLKRYQHDHSAFGTTPFRFSASVASFYGPYVRAVLMLLAIAVIAGVAAAVSPSGAKAAAAGAVLVLFAVGVLAFVVLIGPYLTARLQNVVWNHTILGAHRFQSRLRARKLAWIAISNLLLVVVTLGLFMPFAAVRMARYRVSCMTLLPASSLDTFVADQRSDVAALGEEMGEFLDIDIAL